MEQVLYLFKLCGINFGRFKKSNLSKIEFGNWISHAFGALFALIGGLWIFSLAVETDLLHCVISVGVYVFSIVMLLSSSAVYHYYFDHPQKHNFRKFDHISIFFLIAGTYTPFIICYMDNNMGSIYILILWASVVVGIFYKMFLIGKYTWVSLLFYILMGFSVFFNYQEFSLCLPEVCMDSIKIGGVFYCLGVVFFVWEKYAINHLIWHLFVLAGALAHFVGVYYCVELL